MKKDMTIFDMIEFDEGKKLSLYKDTEGYWTIGIGHLVTKEPEKELAIKILNNIFERETNGILTNDEVEELFYDDVDKVIYNIELSNLNDIYEKLDDVRQFALINMCFQLGVNGVLKFKRSLASLEKEDYPTANIQFKQSKWYTQTPNRAERVINTLTYGVYDVGYFK